MKQEEDLKTTSRFISYVLKDLKRSFKRSFVTSFASSIAATLGRNRAGLNCAFEQRRSGNRSTFLASHDVPMESGQTPFAHYTVESLQLFKAPPWNKLLDLESF
ncbi:hypothetical protein M9H77_30798 [Catharanthus roseus]|uniref:Uncharacterized protein n=1 Tax=Catharanthus roseus TaxID=4058 RepID=A0ACC0A264_CATRO|nr:hypothetical protein M9H77_30798 [Catharanthus roseus]